MDLTADSVEKNRADRSFKVLGYNGQCPGPEIRVREGDSLRIHVHNRLPEPTTIHWHGLPVPNEMDGVPGITQEPIAPGESFTYEFVAWPAGTYIYHSHEGYQLDQGLHGALIVEEREPSNVDREHVLILDGRPVRHVTADAIRIGMGERYDAEVEGRSPGRWPILVWPDTATNDPLTLGALVYEGIAQENLSGDSGFTGRMLGYDELEAVEEEGLPRVGERVDKRIRMVLSGGMHSPHWTIDGEIYPQTTGHRIELGERVRIEYHNRSMMPHPMHLHGQFFELALPGRPLKAP